MLNPNASTATYADTEALPPNVVGEIIDGMLHTHPRPAPRHSVAAWQLAGQIDGPFGRGRGGPGGWRFVAEPELRLGTHVIVPDVGGCRRERMPQLPDSAFVSSAPDWVCEILSPSTMSIDRTRKLAIYAEFGVGHAWYLDPLARTLEVFALTGSQWRIAATFASGDEVRAVPFEAHHFPLDDLWGDADDPSPEKPASNA